MCQVPEGAPSGAHRGGTDSMSTETTEYQDRRRADLLGRLRGARLGLPARPGQGPRRDARGRAARHRARTRRLPAGRAGRDGHRARAARPAGRRRVHPAAAARAEPRPGARGRADPRGLRRVERLDPGAVVGQRPGRLRQPPRARRQGLADAAGQPQPHQPDRRREGNPRGPAPARRHDDREHRRGAAGAGRVVHRAVPGHRAPAHRRHRPRRAHPPGAGPDRARPLQGRRRRARPSTSRTAAGPTPRASPAACTGRWAPATSTSPRSWST